MAAKIGDECINCGMCHQECPYGAIEEGGVDWLDENREIQEAISMDHYFVIPWKCQNCGKCIRACPVDNIVME